MVRQPLKRQTTFVFIICNILFAFVANDASAATHFRFPLAFEPHSLDWTFKRAFYEITVLLNIMEGLVETDENFNPTPALGEKWTESTDKLTYTIELRSGVKWSDGVPLKAQDFIYSWKRLLSPATKSEYGTYLSEIKNADAFYSGRLKDFSQVGVKALNDKTIEVKLARPNPRFIQKFRHYSTFPQRKDLKLTLGPYRLVQWIKGKSLRFERNPLYYGAKPRVDRVTAIIERDPARVRTMLERGELDLIFNATTTDIVRFTTEPTSKYHVRQFDALNVTFVAFKPARGPTKDTVFRRSISRAIDRSQLPTIENSGKVPAVSLIPRNMFGFEAAALTTDIVAAKRILPGRFPLKLAYRSGLHDDLAKNISDQLKVALGLDVSTQPITPNAFLEAVGGGRFDLYVEQWWPDDPDPTSFLKRMTSNNRFNRTGWKNERYDKLIAEAEETTNAIASLRLFAEAQTILLRDEAVVIPLFHAKTTALASNQVTEFKLSPMLNDLYFKAIAMQED